MVWQVSHGDRNDKVNTYNLHVPRLDDHRNGNFQKMLET
jgi:protein subunit release factor A